jgi:hypothetical protein
MGYRGKVAAHEEARRLRAQSWTLADIAAWLGVAKSSVSLWVRDVEFVPSPRRMGARRRPHPMHEAKLAEIAQLNAQGVARIGELSEREFLVAGLALYAGEGAKTDGEVRFTNTDPRMIAFFCLWLRTFFAVDESRLRIRLHLHDCLDVDEAAEFWASLTAIPRCQHTKPYRATSGSRRKGSKHEMGCVSVGYCCSRTHRAVMGLVGALLRSEPFHPG